MKKDMNILMLLCIAVVFAISSCSNFLDINKNPNAVTDDNVTPDVIFPAAENAVGNRAATNYVILNNWVGYWSRSGTFIVEQEEATYKLTSTYPLVEVNWDQAYDILFDLYLTKTKALTAGDSVLAGAAMVLSSKLWQESVDQWGDIPYSKAFNSVTNPQPSYDKATDIYADLLVQLDNAITYLNVKAPKSSFAATDIIFANNATTSYSLKSAIAEWKKLANIIKLRIYLRQSEMGFTPTAAQLAKITTDGGFLGVGEDVSVNPGYSNQNNKQNPFYANFGLTPAGAPATTDNTANNYFVFTIEGVNSANPDPRVNFFFATPILGTDFGALGGDKTGNSTIVGSGIGPGLAVSSTAPQFILPAYESLFFQAEATARGWLPGGDAATQALFESAIKESFRWLGITDGSDTTYIQTVPSAMWANSGATPAQKVLFIAYQKYIAMNGVDPLEAWSDMKRLGVFIPDGYLSYDPQREPSLPNLLPYPQTEITTNLANVPPRSTAQLFTQKSFWQP